VDGSSTGTGTAGVISTFKRRFAVVQSDTSNTKPQMAPLLRFCTHRCGHGRRDAGLRKHVEYFRRPEYQFNTRRADEPTRTDRVDRDDSIRH
jgi:hypothetical protein